MLTELVESGRLPPLKERLPKEPYVVQPGTLVSDEVIPMRPGRFGGTLQLPMASPSGDPTMYVGMIESLLWAPNGFDYPEGIHGSVLKGYETSEDDTEFVFHMRPGLRWSDGEPVTMEDVRFAFEDVLYNGEITPVFPDYLRAGLRSDAAPAKLNVLDDWTFSLAFDRTYGTFLSHVSIAQWRTYVDVIKPRHYLEQFHKKYADPGELKEELEKESIPEDQWFNLFNAKQFIGSLGAASTEQGIGHPVLSPWVLKAVETGVYTLERNPYYFKVDPNGSQLPYMDAIRSQVVQDKEALTARALMGEFDYLGERASMRQLPLIAEKAERGDIKTFVPRQHVLPTTVFLNLTYEDENWRRVVRDLRFRRALSLAMKRKEIIENFYLGEFAKVPTESNPGEHDVEEANRLLDELGLDRRDADGYRLGPNGERFRIAFEIADHTENHIPIGELVAEYWKKVGIFTTVKLIDASLYVERAEANELQATVLWAHCPIWRKAWGDDYLPQTNWGTLWQTWYDTQGQDGEEPPPEVQRLFEDHGRFMSARLGSRESTAAIESIIESHRDNIWNLQVVEDAYWPTFWTTRVKNVGAGIKQDVFGIIATYSIEQWYIEE